MPNELCMRIARRLLLSHCLLLAAWASSFGVARGDWLDDIGYTKLQSALGTSLPLGEGVSLSIVEAVEAGTTKYYPEVGDAEFSLGSDPLGQAVSFTDGSNGQSNGFSNHATSQTRTILGNTTSAAPGANAITVYEANNYLNTVLNMTGSNSTAPDPQNFRVQNFSWVGTFATPNDSTPNPTVTELNNDREALRRFDFVVDRDNISAFVGLGNGTNDLPHLFSHSYNATAVGLSNGDHSTGLTHLASYGTGRSKPEIVAPRGTTSAATASLSSAATFLHSSSLVQGTDAENSEVIKAMLLAGATKQEFADWSQLDASDQWHPLDDTYGAGELNLYNSYLIALGGKQSGSTGAATNVTQQGWDYQNVLPGAGNELLYELEIPSGSTAEELSVILTWNAEVTSPFHAGDPVLADLNLEIVDELGATIDLQTGDGIVEGLSDSSVDNVEHLYLTDLSPGSYTLKVSSASMAHEFGLAWRTSTLFYSPSADFDEDGDVDGSDFFIWQSGLGTLVGATRAQGDADGDGDVDAEDLSYFQEVFGAGSAASLVLSSAVVPEPSVIGLAVLALLGLLLVGGRLGRLSSSSIVGPVDPTR